MCVCVCVCTCVCVCGCAHVCVCVGPESTLTGSVCLNVYKQSNDEYQFHTNNSKVMNKTKTEEIAMTVVQLKVS